MTRPTPPAPEEPDAWESETIDILADLLLADYTLDTYELWGKPWRDVLAIGDPYHKNLQLRFLSSAAPTAAAMGDAGRDPQRVIRMSRRQTGGLIAECTRVTAPATKPDPPNTDALR